MAYYGRRRTVWDIFRDLERQAFEEAERMIRQMKEAELRTGCITPLYEVYETDNEVIISIDLPGSSKEEINLEIQEGTLTLEAPCRKPIPTTRHGEKYTLQIKIPEETEPEKTTARYQNGVLEIRIPKKQPRKGIKVKIQ